MNSIRIVRFWRASGLPAIVVALWIALAARIAVSETMPLPPLPTPAPVFSPDGGFVAFLFQPGNDPSADTQAYIAKLEPKAWNHGWTPAVRLGQARQLAWTSNGKNLILAAPADASSRDPNALIRRSLHPADSPQAVSRTVYSAPKDRVILDFALLRNSAIILHAPIPKKPNNNKEKTASGSPSRQPGMLIRVNLERGSEEIITGEDTVLSFSLDAASGRMMVLDTKRGLVRVNLGVTAESHPQLAAEKLTGRDTVLLSPNGKGCLIFNSDALNTVPPVLYPDIDSRRVGILPNTPPGALMFDSANQVRVVGGSTLFLPAPKGKKWIERKHPAGVYAGLRSVIRERSGVAAWLDRRGCVVESPATRQQVVIPVTALNAAILVKQMIDSDRFNQALSIARRFRASAPGSVESEQATARLWELEAYSQFRLQNDEGAAYAAEYALLTFPVRVPWKMIGIESGKALPFADSVQLAQFLLDKGIHSDLLEGMMKAEKIQRAGKFTVAGKFYEKLQETTGDPLLRAGLAFYRGMAYLRARKVLPASKAFEDAAAQRAFPQADLAEAMQVCSQWLHPERSWQNRALKIADEFKTRAMTGPRAGMRNGLKEKLQAIMKRKAPASPQPLEVIIPGRAPEKETRDGAEIQGPPEPDGSLLAITSWQYSVTLSAITGPEIEPTPVTRVYWKLPNGASGNFQLPMAVDSIAVQRDSEMAAFLERTRRDGKSGGNVVAVDLPENRVNYGPYFIAGAVSVGLDEDDFVVRDNTDESLRHFRPKRKPASKTSRKPSTNRAARPGGHYPSRNR